MILPLYVEDIRGWMEEALNLQDYFLLHSLAANYETLFSFFADRADFED